MFVISLYCRVVMIIMHRSIVIVIDVAVNYLEVLRNKKFFQPVTSTSMQALFLINYCTLPRLLLLSKL